MSEAGKFKEVPLVLGTAQLGMPYGIANATGQPDQVAADEIVGAAWEHGIREYDTAQGYGVSELVLGHALATNACAGLARVTTKLGPEVQLDRDSVFRAVDSSIERLGVAGLEAVLFHCEGVIDAWTPALALICRELVAGGKTRRVGVSVYAPDAAMRAICLDGVDVLQGPASVLDRRLEAAGVFELARERGCLVYLRSVFVQGLLLMSPDELPPNMRFAERVLRRVASVAEDLGVTRRELALGYLRQKGYGRVVFGAESTEQVRENVATWRGDPVTGVVDVVERDLRDIDEEIIRPDRWPK